MSIYTLHTQALTLSGSGATIGSTSVSLRINEYLISIGGITMANFGEKGWATIDQGLPTEEEISFTGIVVASSILTLTGVKNVGQKTPSVETDGCKYTHIGGSVLSFSDAKGLWDTFANTYNENQWNTKQVFNVSPTIPDATASNQPVSLTQLNNVVVGAVGTASETTSGLLAKATIDDYIEGEGNLLPDSVILNSNSYENGIDFISAGNNNLIVIGSDNNLYLQNIINGKTISTTALSTGTRTETFSKILIYTSPTDVLLLTTTNTLVRFTGSNTFVNVAFGSGSLAFPPTKCISAVYSNNNVYLSFIGSKKMWVMSNTFVITSSNDLVLNDINGLAGYLFTFDIDTTNNVAYATAITDATGVDITDLSVLYKINLNTFAVDTAGDNTTISALGDLKNITFYKNDTQNANLILNRYNGGASVNNFTNFVALIKAPLPASSTPFSTANLIITANYNMVISNNWAGNSPFPTNIKTRSIIIGDTQYFLSYPFTNSTTTSNSAELFYNNLLANTPAAITPDIAQVLTSSALTITARKANFNFNNSKTTFAGGTLTITPPTNANTSIGTLTTTNAGSGLTAGTYTNVVVANGTGNTARASVVIQNFISSLPLTITSATGSPTLNPAPFTITESGLITATGTFIWQNLSSGTLTLTSITILTTPNPSTSGTKTITYTGGSGQIVATATNGIVTSVSITTNGTGYVNGVATLTPTTSWGGTPTVATIQNANYVSGNIPSSSLIGGTFNIIFNGNNIGSGTCSGNVNGVGTATGITITSITQIIPQNSTVTLNITWNSSQGSAVNSGTLVYTTVIPVFNITINTGVRNDLIVIDSNNTLQARLGNETTGVLGQGITGDVILGECQSQYQGDAVSLINYDSKSIYDKNYFGDGSDGNVIISTNTTLTRDMYYNNLTINAGITLTTAGFKIYVKNDLTNNGTISNNGVSLSAGLGSNGQNGGAGGGAGGNAGGFTGGTVTNMILSQLNSYLVVNNSYGKRNGILDLGNNYPQTNFGVGGGGALNSPSSSGTTYGSGGGLVLIFALNIVNGGNITSLGGNATNGFSGFSNGGGGGGAIIVLYRNKINNYTTNVSGGSGTNGGGAGSNGNVYDIQLT